MLNAKSANERNTRQKQAIREVFLHSVRPLSVEEVLEAAVDHGAEVSLPTVYRNVRSLLSEGWLASVELPGRTPVYETAERTHHHHFNCISCNRVFELEGCEAPRMHVPPGFTAVDHHVTVTGYCQGCTRKRPTRKAS